MTKEQREKALAFLKDMQECTYDGVEEIRTAIECLEQPTSDDCVSRTEVDQRIYDYAESNGLSYANMKYYILDVPSVTPTRKVGKWIMPDKYCDKNIWRKCSVCKTDFEMYHKYVAFSGEVTYIKELANYCKVCGAEMVGVEND